MDGRKSNHKKKMQPKTSQAIPLTIDIPNAAFNGNGREITSPNLQSLLGTRAMMRNAEGLQNGIKTTDPRFQSQDDKGKNKAPKSPYNANGSPIQYREHEQYLPVANVVRIMRRGLPPNAKLADEAKEMMQESVTEFISFITSEANQSCQQEHRKTITAEDVIGAMSKLGFDNYIEPLMMYLQKYRDSEMIPMTSRFNVPHGSNGTLGFDSATRVGATGSMQPTNGGPPPFAVPTLVHPQYSMFASAGNGEHYHDGSGPRVAQFNRGEQSAADGAAGTSASP